MWVDFVDATSILSLLFLDFFFLKFDLDRRVFVSLLKIYGLWIKIQSLLFIYIKVTTYQMSLVVSSYIFVLIYDLFMYLFIRITIQRTSVITFILYFGCRAFFLKLVSNNTFLILLQSYSYNKVIYLCEFKTELLSLKFHFFFHPLSFHPIEKVSFGSGRDRVK